MSLCSFTQGEKRHLNRCSYDVGTFIWRHERNHKCKHISLVREHFVLQPVILWWWPKVIFNSFYRINYHQAFKGEQCRSNGEGSIVPSRVFKKMRMYPEVCQFLDWVLTLFNNQPRKFNKFWENVQIHLFYLLVFSCMDYCVNQEPWHGAWNSFYYHRAAHCNGRWPAYKLPNCKHIFLLLSFSYYMLNLKASHTYNTSFFY